MSDIQVLSDNEKHIVEQIRNLRPYETITIQADVNGRPDSFLLTRSSKVMLIVRQQPVHIKTKLHLQE